MDIVPGAMFGSWTVLRVEGRAAWVMCRCTTVRQVALEALQGGESQSCGSPRARRGLSGLPRSLLRSRRPRRLAAESASTAGESNEQEIRGNVAWPDSQAKCAPLSPVNARSTLINQIRLNGALRVRNGPQLARR
jgi:hypothetical protein